MKHEKEMNKMSKEMPKKMKIIMDGTKVVKMPMREKEMRSMMKSMK